MTGQPPLLVTRRATLVIMTLPSWVPDIERKPAPQPLLLVQSFVNTRDLLQETDVLTDADEASRWLHESGLLIAAETALTAEDLHFAREVRESIRVLIARNSGGPALTASHLRPLRTLASASPPHVKIDWAGQVTLGPAPHGQLTDGLAWLLLIVRDAQADGSWDRLKTCTNPECLWAFFDRSHSRRGQWCDMASCGNVIKNRNLRARRASHAG